MATMTDRVAGVGFSWRIAGFMIEVIGKEDWGVSGLRAMFVFSIAAQQSRCCLHRINANVSYFTLNGLLLTANSNCVRGSRQARELNR